MLTPYQFASNRPIDGIDLDGLEYFDANVNLQLDQEKTKVRLTGHLEIIVKVINLSNSEVKSSALNYHKVKSSRTFDNSNPVMFSMPISLNPETGERDVTNYSYTGELNIDFVFPPTGNSSLEDINKGDVVLVLVDKVGTGDNDDNTLAITDRSGYAYIMEIDAFNSRSNVDTHEKGHLIGDLQDRHRDENDGNLMTLPVAEESYDLSPKQRFEIISNLVYRHGLNKGKGIGDMNHDTRKDVEGLLKNYDRSNN